MTKYMEKGVHLVAAGNVLVILHYILLSLHVLAASRNLTVSKSENFPICLVCLAFVVICKMAHHAK